MLFKEGRMKLKGDFLKHHIDRLCRKAYVLLIFAHYAVFFKRAESIKGAIMEI